MPKLWLAPLHGVTVYTFRNCLFRHISGIDATIAPFVPVQSTATLNVKKWKDLLPDNNKETVLIPQLMGTVPSFFTDTMNALHDELGYTHFNWNLGCPMHPIVRKKRGCGLMPYPDDVEAIVENACKLPFKFSVKMRLGLHSFNEGLEIANRLNQYPLEFIVIHPRLGDWQYEGQPDLEALDNFLGQCQHKIIYSGDIFQLSDYQCLSKKYNQIQDWMLGRGILRNPFLASEIKNTSELSEKQKIENFNEFYEDLVASLLEVRSESGTLASLKELWHSFAHIYHLNENQIHNLLIIDNLKDFLEETTALQLTINN